jgi:hypothetical protein
LLAMSAATIDRVLRLVREPWAGRAAALGASIGGDPERTFADWDNP